MDDKLLKLRNYLKDRGFTQVKIAELFNVDKGYINQLLTGRKAFGKRTAQEWSDQFGLSASWLLTGEGEMTKESTKTDDSSSPCFDITTIQGGAGHGTGMEQITDSMLDQAAGRMLAPGLPTGNNIPYIQVRGNSMLNHKDPALSIPDGAWVGIKASTLSTIRWGDVYAVMTTDGPIVKKIVPSDKENCIRCVSFNEEDGFMPFDLPYTDIILPLYNVLAVVNIKLWK